MKRVVISGVGIVSCLGNNQSVNAIIKDTSAINIRTVIAIIKWPIV